MYILTVVVSVLLALVFLAVGIAKLRATEHVNTTMDGLRVTPGLRNIIGTLEILGAVGVIAGLWLEPLGVVAAAGLVLLTIGAIIFHVRARESVKQFAPVFGFPALAGIVAALQATNI